jgi:2-deoxy-D-gluconate 3-dehydrogenase
MSGRLAGKRALVTGASRGIGRAIAIAYAAEGADVALLARDEAKLSEVASEIEALGRRAVVLACDVTDAEAIGAAVSRAIVELGGIDVVVNNAGGNSFSRPLADLRHSGWTKTFALNVDSTVHVLQAVLPGMIERGAGSVINVSSVAALRGAPGMSHYAAAKAAVVTLTETLAVEVARSGVRANSLVPGWIETDLTEFLRTEPGSDDELINRVPMHRWGTVEEIAAPAVFLASDESSFMTGQCLVVDGGLSVNP